MSPVAFAVCSASAFTSEATTAKPRPASPARAASMVAFSAKRLVWPAMALMSSTTSPMRAAALDNSLTRSLVCPAWVTASPAMRAEACTWRLISLTEAVSSSAADATDCTLVAASSDAASTSVASSVERLAVVVSDVADASSSLAADDTVSTISPIAPSKSSAILIMSARRRSAASLSCLIFSSASSCAFRSALILNVSTACAISPISSGRPRPGRTMAKLPLASSIIAARIAVKGLETERPMKMPRPSTLVAISAIATAIQNWMLVRSASLRRSASARMRSTDVETCSITGSTDAKASDIAFDSAASFSAVSIQAEKSR
ncbi:hypothetical protein ABH992_002568 [Bradyrhizobium yuanmingense]|uniref:Uncharacterized protein n=1 Tax=Bradyrhizobium yuanmingense TaxID=108015 RepID=A0ABV4GFX8_9BRAD